jgi:hypothetical protein
MLQSFRASSEPLLASMSAAIGRISKLARRLALSVLNVIDRATPAPRCGPGLDE